MVVIFKYWFKCPNECNLIVCTNTVKNIGTCPFCKADWLTMKAEEKNALQKKWDEREKKKCK